jgi:hypothetical protein
MMNASILQELADKRALDELISRQALALDKRDWVTYRSCLADGEVHYDFTDHTDRVIGRHIGVEHNADSWVAKVKSVMPGFDGSQHLITNILHTITAAKSHSECFVLADHFLNNETGDRSITMGGIYTFDSVRSSSGWKIKRWVLKILWYRGNPTIYQLAQERSCSVASK